MTKTQDSTKPATCNAPGREGSKKPCCLYVGHRGDHLSLVTARTFTTWANIDYARCSDMMFGGAR